jgi:hypothetical protein
MAELVMPVSKLVALVVLLAAITQIDATLAIKISLAAGAWLAWA